MAVFPLVCWRSRTVSPGWGKKHGEDGERKKYTRMTHHVGNDAGADQLPATTPSLSLRTPPGTQLLLLDVSQGETHPTCPKPGRAQASPSVLPEHHRTPGAGGARLRRWERRGDTAQCDGLHCELGRHHLPVLTLN